MSYHEHTDCKYARNLRAGAPEAVKAFMELDKQVLRNPGNTIPPKYAELMAVAVALTTQCAYCIETLVAGEPASFAGGAKAVTQRLRKLGLPLGGARIYSASDDHEPDVTALRRSPDPSCSSASPEHEADVTRLRRSPEGCRRITSGFDFAQAVCLARSSSGTALRRS
ncbi:carboxymuconolactone decarboxylase family protein [Streptomyces antimycoticus]|uniref:carboxymuconolactone decarboxylase family protein n=1 Tax=Streptomyces antimycoticus TaxID=68175 RepID=UPI0036C90F24